MHEWPSAFAAADYNQNRDPEAKKYGMKRIWNNRFSARGWGKAAAVFTMAMVLAVGGLGAAMNLADLQGVVTVQPIVRQQSGMEPEQKTKLFGKKQTEAAASSEECAADSTEEPRTAEGRYGRPGLCLFHSLHSRTVRGAVSPSGSSDAAKPAG